MEYSSTVTVYNASLKPICNVLQVVYSPRLGSSQVCTLFELQTQGGAGFFHPAEVVTLTVSVI